MLATIVNCLSVIVGSLLGLLFHRRIGENFKNVVYSGIGTVDAVLWFRIPSWCPKPKLAVNGSQVDISAVCVKGYAKLAREWKAGDRVELNLPMETRRVEARPEVRQDSGRVAIERGPVVYCAEEVDNGPRLQDLSLAPKPKFSVETVKGLPEGTVCVGADASVRDPKEWGPELYREYRQSRIPKRILFVPYAFWGNRKKGAMTVWVGQA